MALDAWLPVGQKLPDGAIVCAALFGGREWQIYETVGGGRALLARSVLTKRWLDAGLVEFGLFDDLLLGNSQLQSISCGPSQILCPVSEAHYPDNKAEALSFALALKASREIDSDSPLQDTLYIERITRLLPTYSISSRTSDEVVLGNWLTGGTNIPATAFRRLRQTMSWLDASHLRDVVQAAGFEIAEIAALEHLHTLPADITEAVPDGQKADGWRRSAPEPGKLFELAGRPVLSNFFNEHIIDIVLHRARYQTLGINFPSALILHGPPGCGKTFAVERLIEFLGWPRFEIDASSVASPYIHETSKKVAQVFEKAIESSPSVLVIDEMEAFLADREMGAGSSHHRVEEVAEFLRRIPEAVKNDVLIIAMTNRISMIDPAIQRRGRFDHVIKVDFASEVEVRSLLDELLSALPKEIDVDSKSLAKELAGRPLSDVCFVVREGARLAARAGKSRLDHASLLSALYTSTVSEHEGEESKRRIGFT